MGSLRFWVFEDSPADAKLLSLSLDSHFGHYELVHIDDGESAAVEIERCASGQVERPDIFVIDLNLPKRDGMELLKLIKESNALRGIPAIVLSSSNSSRDRSMAQQLGASAFIQKPFNLAEYLGIGGRLREYVNATG